MKSEKWVVATFQDGGLIGQLKLYGVFETMWQAEAYADDILQWRIASVVEIHCMDDLLE
jgi:hypothetical protein